MKVLFDTNIILDLLLARDPFLEHSQIITEAVESKLITGYLCATTITTIHYLCEKYLGKNASIEAMEKLLQTFEIAQVNKTILQQALVSNFSDFEDAVLYYSSINAQVNGIVTRNRKGFLQSTVSIYSPKELIGLLSL